MARSLTVLFAGGGTGGHLYPAFAIAEALQARGDHVVFVGTRDRLEARLVPAAGYQLRTIAAYPLARRLSFALVRTLAANVLGFFQSLRVLSQTEPDAVVATGGYVCVPLVLAARARGAFARRRAPIALLEPNAVAGVASRALRPFADDIWDGETTGVPVRASLLHAGPRAQAVARLGLDPEKKTLFAFGASQGARSINEAVVALLVNDALPDGWQVLHVTGERDYERVRDAVGARSTLQPYLDDPTDAYAAADLVLCRAGASTLAELSALGLPAILVPYPHATEAHQQANAEAFAVRGSAVVIEDGALRSRLAYLLAEVTKPERLAAMRERAAAGARRNAASAILARIDRLVSRIRSPE